MYNITNESSENVKLITSQLPSYIRYNPQLVADWIDALELKNFKQKHLTELVVGVILCQCDLKAILIHVAASGVNEIKQSYLLDGYTGRQRQDNSRVHIHVRMIHQGADPMFKV